MSGPLLDRIDIHVDVPRVNYEKLASDRPSESSQPIRAGANRTPASAFGAGLPPRAQAVADDRESRGFRKYRTRTSHRGTVVPAATGGVARKRGIWVPLDLGSQVLTHEPLP